MSQRLVSRHHDVERGHDFYASPPEALWGLLAVEGDFLQGRPIWEPACGDGALVKPLRAAGYTVRATDLVDRGCPDATAPVDFLQETVAFNGAIVTNPPFKHALSFVKCGLKVSEYVALLLRLQFLEGGTERLSFFRQTPFSRVHVFSSRLPMMHRGDWQGKRSTSNTCFAWFVWDKHSPSVCEIGWISKGDIEWGRRLCGHA